MRERICAAIERVMADYERCRREQGQECDYGREVFIRELPADNNSDVPDEIGLCLPPVDISIRHEPEYSRLSFCLVTGLLTEPPFVFNGLTQWRALEVSGWMLRNNTWLLSRDDSWHLCGGDSRGMRFIESELGWDATEAVDKVMDFLGCFDCADADNVAVIDDMVHHGDLKSAHFPPGFRGLPSIEAAIRRADMAVRSLEKDCYIVVGLAVSNCEVCLEEGRALSVSYGNGLEDLSRILEYANLGCLNWGMWHNGIILWFDLPTDTPEFSAALLTDFLSHMCPRDYSGAIPVTIDLCDFRELRREIVTYSPDGSELSRNEFEIDLEKYGFYDLDGSYIPCPPPLWQL